jgi:hypothetical protein
MAKASDNVFPYVHVAPAAAPASPSAGSERLYLDSADGNKLKRKDSSGTVTTIEGGSAAVPTASATRTAGDVTLSYSASLTAVNSGLDLTLAASTGDVIELAMYGAISGHSTGSSAMNVNLTAKTRVSAADVNNVAPSGATFVPAWFVPDVAAASGPPVNLGGSHLYTVQSGDISGGTVTFRFYYQTDNAGAATRTLYAASGTLPLTVYAKNLRH